MIRKAGLAALLAAIAIAALVTDAPADRDTLSAEPGAGRHPFVAGPRPAGPSPAGSAPAGSVPASPQETMPGTSAGPTPTAGQANPAPPEPHVNPFAGQLAGTVHAPGPRVSDVTVSEGTDGCDHAYGNLGQCVPWQFPAGTTSRCGWLTAHGFGPLTVHGRDRHGLDTNHDGVACGPGDAR